MIATLIARSSFVEDLSVIATFLICRRLEGDSYVPHLYLRVIATFLICRRLEGDSYVPPLYRVLEGDSYVPLLFDGYTYVLICLNGERSSFDYVPLLSET